MPEIQLQRSPVELYKILKFEGLAASGGEAKALIDAGAVHVNGITETRKRCKIRPGDVIELHGERYAVSGPDPADATP